MEDAARRSREPAYWKRPTLLFFIVKLDQEQNAFKRVSYSYADILTETVEVTVVSDEGQVRIAYDQQ